MLLYWLVLLSNNKKILGTDLSVVFSSKTTVNSNSKDLHVKLIGESTLAFGVDSPKGTERSYF